MKTKQYIYISLLIITLMVVNMAVLHGQEKDKVWHWITSMGSSSWDYVNGIETDSKANVYIGGAYTTELTISKKDIESQGKQDLFIAKYNNKGKLQWVWNAGGKQSDKLTALYVNNKDEIILSGIISGEVKIEKQTFTGEEKKLILAKLTDKKKLIWIKSFPIENMASIYHIYENESIGLTVAGTFKKTLIIEGQKVESLGKEDLFLAHFSMDGKLEKLKAFGSKGKDIITAFAANENGKLYFSASYQGDITIDDYNLASPGPKVTGAFIAAFNQELETEWLQTFQSEQYLSISAIASTISNQLYLSGNFTHTIQYGNHKLKSKGGMDIFTAKLNSSGEAIWMKNYGSPYNDYSKNIELNPAGGFMLNGTFNDTLLLDSIQLNASKGNTTAFVSQVNPRGELFWAESIGGNTNVSSNHSTLDKQGNIFVSGSFTRTIKNDKFNISSQGKEDIYIAKYFNCPDYPNQIQGDTYLCPNTEQELKVKGSFDNISWNNGLYTEKRISISQAGTYFLEMTDKNACLVLDTIVVEEVQGPAFNLGNDTVLFTDQSLYLSGPGNMNEYLWFNDQTWLSTNVYSQGDFEHQIDVWLQVSDSLNCQFTDSLLLKFEVRSPMLNIDQVQDIILYPNPVSEIMHWSINCEQKSSLVVEISNIEGQKVYFQKIYNYISGQTESIPVNNLPAGNYYLNIGNNTEKVTKMFVIIKE